MSGSRFESSPVPEKVLDVLKDNRIGYLSVISKKGELYSYPVAYHYSDDKVYFVTPVSAAKFKIIKTNPTVSFIVDNGKVTTEACGAMIQGKARIFTVARTLLSILSVGPKIAGFSKKYPGMLTFYARGKDLPDERKLYKYRLIRIEPLKIIFWNGYNFGRFTSPKKDKTSEDSLNLTPDESGVGVAAKLLQPTDDEIQSPVGSGNHDWLVALDTIASEGVLSSTERDIIRSYRGLPSQISDAETRASVTDEERRLLKKSKN
ncbi:MAG TPA: pyridoxamine 5'-phosphate oxidase family protein [Candidatus Angelobacter sp.]|nr:pyridoxamine 5'-phosphate oxidase family protein [Candidatus Angelobacter sp.]